MRRYLHAWQYDIVAPILALKARDLEGRESEWSDWKSVEVNDIDRCSGCLGRSGFLKCAFRMCDEILWTSKMRKSDAGIIVGPRDRSFHDTRMFGAALSFTHYFLLQAHSNSVHLPITATNICHISPNTLHLDNMEFGTSGMLNEGMAGVLFEV